MDDRMPPEGQPESRDATPPPEPEPPASGPIGWPEQPAGADAPTEATPTPGAPPPAAAAAPPPPAQPAFQWQAPAPAVAVAGARAPRTTLSAAGGVVLLALGIIGLLFGVLFLASAALIGQLIRDYYGEIPNVTDQITAGGVVGGVIAFFAVLVIAYSVAYILGGIGVLRSAEWGRWLGIVVAVISGLIWGSGLTGSGEGFAFGLVMFLAHLYVFWALVFRWREPVPPGAMMPPA